MNEKQAVKFWNAIASGRIIGMVPETSYMQGYPIEEPTYTSTICYHHEMTNLTVPVIDYDHLGSPKGTIKPNKNDANKVADFLRMIADKIESSATIEL